MSTLRDTAINNNLNISSHLGVNMKIINNDIIYPIITVTGDPGGAQVISVYLRKFNNNLTINGRPKIHWWISSAIWSYPVVVTGLTSITVSNGINLDPLTSPNTAILRTSLSDSNGIYAITVTNSGAGSGTYYFMCAVQGIVYSQSFQLFIG